jgi:hypothetical protein
MMNLEDAAELPESEQIALGKRLAAERKAASNFVAVYLDRHDEIAEAAEQIVRATVGVLEAAGGVWVEDGDDVRKLYTTEVDTGSDSAGVVISTAELSEEDATALWQAYASDDEAVLEEWEAKGWKAVD